MDPKVNGMGEKTCQLDIKKEITKWEHTFSHSDKERKIIEDHAEENSLSYNGAIRDIIRRYNVE